MNIGMLWQDHTKDKPIVKKIQEAAKYHKEKYRFYPNICHISLKQYPEGIGSIVDEIEIILDKSILVNHLWIGIGDKDIYE